MFSLTRSAQLVFHSCRRNALPQGKTRKFIDKKTATRFTLLNRAQSDAHHNSEDHSDLVLKPILRANEVRERASLCENARVALLLYIFRARLSR